MLLLQIIAHCDAIGDKVVVFSQSLPTLSYIEEILNSPDWGGFNFFSPNMEQKRKLGGWRRNQDYLRIDGVSAIVALIMLVIDIANPVFSFLP